MLSEKMEAALNQQINEELYSAYIYLAMAAYFYDQNLEGFANWMRIQNQEETVHAMKFYDYIFERNGRVKLLPLEGPPTEWKSPLDGFQAAYQHEQKISGLINNLVTLALQESDHATWQFLQWFVSEQVEEEANADRVVQSLKLVGDNPTGLFMLDRELVERTLEPTTDA